MVGKANGLYLCLLQDVQTWWFITYSLVYGKTNNWKIENVLCFERVYFYDDLRFLGSLCTFKRNRDELRIS